MHSSDTLDIFFIIARQVELTLDDGITILRSGETIIQRGRITAGGSLEMSHALLRGVD